jgi:hypothetical protein
MTRKELAQLNTIVSCEIMDYKNNGYNTDVLYSLLRSIRKDYFKLLRETELANNKPIS